MPKKDTFAHTLFLARMRGRRAAQVHMGELRDLAVSQEGDEEVAFQAIAANWLRGLRSELSRLFEAEKTAQLLNPFDGKSEITR
jgi:hypothetical protein